MSQTRDNDPDWLSDLPELLQSAAEEIKALAETGTAPLRRELGLVSPEEIDRLASLLERMEQRLSDLESRLEQLEGQAKK